MESIKHPRSSGLRGVEKLRSFTELLDSELLLGPANLGIFRCGFGKTRVAADGLDR